MSGHGLNCYSIHKDPKPPLSLLTPHTFTERSSLISLHSDLLSYPPNIWHSARTNWSSGGVSVVGQCISLIVPLPVRPPSSSSDRDQKTKLMPSPSETKPVNRLSNIPLQTETRIVTRTGQFNRAQVGGGWIWKIAEKSHVHVKIRAQQRLLPPCLSGLVERLHRLRVCNLVEFQDSILIAHDEMYTYPIPPVFKK